MQLNKTERFLLITVAFLMAFVIGHAILFSPTTPTYAAEGDTNLINLVLSGDASVGKDLNLDEQTTVVVTQDGTITPTGTYQPLSAAGAVGTSDIAAGVEGDLLLLYNVGANTITLTDTGDLLLSGNAVLTASNTLLLLFDGADWVEISRSDNS